MSGGEQLWHGCDCSQAASAKSALGFGVLQRCLGSPSHRPAPVTGLKTFPQAGSGPSLYVPQGFASVEPCRSRSSSWLGQNHPLGPSAHHRSLLHLGLPRTSPAFLPFALVGPSPHPPRGTGASEFWVAEPHFGWQSHRRKGPPLRGRPAGWVPARRAVPEGDLHLESFLVLIYSLFGAHLQPRSNCRSGSGCSTPIPGSVSEQLKADTWAGRAPCPVLASPRRTGGPAPGSSPCPAPTPLPTLCAAPAGAGVRPGQGHRLRALR